MDENSAITPSPVFTREELLDMAWETLKMENSLLEQRLKSLIEKLEVAKAALDSIAEPKHERADTNEHWTGKGCPERWAEVMATDTRLAREALKRLEKYETI